jgi:hypothetical protein
LSKFITSIAINEKIRVPIPLAEIMKILMVVFLFGKN